MVKATPSSKVSYLFKNVKNLLDSNVNLKVIKQDTFLVITFDRKTTKNLYTQCIFLFIAMLGLCFIFTFPLMFCIFYTIFVILFFTFQFLGTVKEDSLEIVKSLGYQITTKYVIGQKTLFIPWNRVQNIFINEVILRDKVIPLLTILTKDDEKLIPLFLEVKPCLQSLERIYRSIKELTS